LLQPPVQMFPYFLIQPLDLKAELRDLGIFAYASWHGGNFIIP